MVGASLRAAIGLITSTRPFTVLGVDNAKSGICYMYIMYVGWYVCPLNARAGNVFLQKTRYT